MSVMRDKGTSDLGERYPDEKLRELRTAVDDHGNDAIGRQALEALGTIRDDRALRHIHAVATRGKNRISRRAAQILGEVSRERGLSPAELEDLIVPDLGLDEHCSLTLDYGPRQFTVGFDDQLVPRLAGNGGRDLAALPRAAQSDDPEKAGHAAATWKKLKADVREIGRAEALRLERAMCAERQWTGVALKNRVFNHPLLGRLAKRLVFAVPASATSTMITFRVAGDGTYEDAEEHMVAVAEDAHVVIIHPAMLTGSKLAQWRQIFDDYEIVQPFAQLSRPVPRLSEEDLRTSSTLMFSRTDVNAKRFWALRHHGWNLSSSAWTASSSRVTLGSREWTAKLDVTPGLSMDGWKLGDTKHVIGALSLTSTVTFDMLSPIERAELLREVSLV